MREVKAADAAAGPHGAALGELDAGVLVHVEELPKNPLLGVIGAGGIAGCGANAAILFFDQLVPRKLLVATVTPFFPNAFMQILGEGLGEAVGERLGHDGVVVVVVGLEFFDEFFEAVTGGDGEGAEVISVLLVDG